MARRIGANRRQRKSGTRALGTQSPTITGIATRLLPVLAIATAAVMLLPRISRLVASNNLLKISSVRVVGISNIDTTDALSLASVSVGESILSFNATEISRRLTAHAWVSSVSIRRLLPGTITIDIRERIPVALVNLGSIHLVDEEGIVLPLTNGQYLDLPLVSGLQDTVDGRGLRRLNSHSLHRMRTFFTSMNTNAQGRPIKLSQIAFSGNERIRLRIESAPVIVELDSSRLESGVRRLGRILDILNRSPAGIPAHINLCYHNCAYVR